MDTLMKILISTYPKNVRLDDRSSVVLRPLLKNDEGDLYAYFSKLPMKDRACLRDDVTDPRVIERWVNDLDYDEVLPLVARDNGKIIGSGTLHFNKIGWSRHQAEVRLTTDVNYRERGLGTHIAQNLIDIATELGLEQLSIEMSPDLQEAFFLFEKLGFKEAAVLKGFVRDLEGNEANLVLMIRFLNEPDAQFAR